MHHVHLTLGTFKPHCLLGVSVLVRLPGASIALSRSIVLQLPLLYYAVLLKIPLAETQTLFALLMPIASGEVQSSSSSPVKRTLAFYDITLPASPLRLPTHDVHASYLSVTLTSAPLSINTHRAFHLPIFAVAWRAVHPLGLCMFTGTVESRSSVDVST